MAVHRVAVTRATNYPFLTLQPVLEGREVVSTLELSGDELEDYEETVKKFAKWQERLSRADELPVHATLDVGAPHGGAMA